MECPAVSKVEPVSLSLNDKRLLVVEKQRLTVFDIEKRKPKRTSLPDSLQAEHALETLCGTFVVCGQVAGKPGVIEVNRRGGLLHMCDPQYLEVPCYLSIFGNDEADLLVVDGRSHRVILLNSGLELVRVFLDKDHDDVLQPCRIVKSGYFLVGHAESSDDSVGVVSLYWPQKSALQPLPDF